MSLNFYRWLLQVLNTRDADGSVGWSYPRRYRERPMDSIAFDGRVRKKKLSMGNIRGSHADDNYVPMI